MSKPLIQTTGRRKRAVARVRVPSGHRHDHRQQREVDDYFPSETHRMILTEPLRLTNTAEVYDIDATIDGGGPSGQAGALRLGIARALVELDPELRADLKKAGFLTRDAREKEIQEVRPQEGPQGAAVLEALTRRPVVAVPPRSAPTGVRGVRPISLSWHASGCRPRVDRPPRRGSWRPRRAGAGPRPLRDRPRHPRVGSAARGGAGGRAVAGEGRAVESPRRGAHPGRGACVCAARGVPGAMISASHNPFADNGIKFFAAGGLKLTDDVEEAARGRARPAWLAVAGDGGRAPAPSRRAAGDGGDDRRGRPTSSPLPGRRWSTRSRVAASTGCGSSSTAPTARRRYVAPDVLRRAGGRASTVIHAEPDGRNINDGCGSTHPGDLQAAVVASRRRPSGWPSTATPTGSLAVDEPGDLVDGDHLHRPVRHRPARPGPAGRRHGRRHGDDQPRVPAGHGRAGHRGGRDPGRRPLRARGARGRRLALGGEQSGHVIFRRLATTGDGLLTGVQLLDLVAAVGPAAGRAGGRGHDPAAPGAANVRVAERRRPTSPRRIADEIAAVEAELGDHGPGAGAGQRHRAAGAGDGRGDRRRPWPRRRPTAWWPPCEACDRLTAPDGPGSDASPVGSSPVVRSAYGLLGLGRPLSWVLTGPAAHRSAERWIRGSDRAAWRRCRVPRKSAASHVRDHRRRSRRPSERRPPLARRDLGLLSRVPAASWPAPGGAPTRPPAGLDGVGRHRRGGHADSLLRGCAGRRPLLAGDPALWPTVDPPGRGPLATRSSIIEAASDPWTPTGVARRRRRHRGRQRRAGRPEGRGVGHRARPAAHGRRAVRRAGRARRRDRRPVAPTCRSSRRSRRSTGSRSGAGTRPACTCWCAATSSTSSSPAVAAVLADRATDPLFGGRWRCARPRAI